MKNKILVFVYNKKEDKFLLVFNTKHPNHTFNKKGFTITRVINEKEYPLERVIAEIKYRIGLTPDEIFSLNWGSVYNLKELCVN